MKRYFFDKSPHGHVFKGANYGRAWIATPWSEPTMDYGRTYSWRVHTYTVLYLMKAFKI